MITSSNLENPTCNEQISTIHSITNNKKIIAILFNSSCVPLHLNYKRNISKLHNIYPVITSKSDYNFKIKYNKLFSIFSNEDSINNLTLNKEYKDSLFTIYPNMKVLLLKAKDQEKDIFLLNYHYDKKWFTSLFPFCTPIENLYVNKM